MLSSDSPAGTAPPAAILVRNFSKRYGAVTAVRGLNLDVPPGEILGLVGPNGAGKTTTLRALAGILRPTEGTLAIAGYDLAIAPVEAKRRLAFIPDEPHLFDYLTVEEHLRFTARLYGVADAEARIVTRCCQPPRAEGEAQSHNRQQLSHIEQRRVGDCAAARPFGEYE